MLLWALQQIRNETLITLLCYISVKEHYFTYHQPLELEDIVRASEMAAIEVIHFIQYVFETAGAILCLCIQGEDFFFEVITKEAHLLLRLYDSVFHTSN
ncbi:hypothetical protein VIGAN_02291100 [Vigna angularis var. angularis]|uniref:Uncharacterized protein n=1 Tax=Vigna angularis var. angularis TaxID=157739 RepID=A0A0S3RH32_PHAAN|nr:hypothetical protein VIGAN_02291100 [Vigna angularis var. angularis]